MRRFNDTETAAIAGGVASLLIGFLQVAEAARRAETAELRFELLQRSAEMFADYNVLRGLIGLPKLNVAQAVDEYNESTARSQGRG